MIDISIIITFLAASITTQRNSLLLTAIFIVSAEMVAIRRIVKTHLISVLLALAFILLMISTKQIPDYLYGRDAAHCFGFTYIHQVPYLLFFCMLDYLYLKEKPIRFFEAGLILFMSYYLLRLTTISLVFYLTIITIVLYYLIRKYPLISINRKWVKRLSTYIPSACAIASFYMMVNYNPSNPRWLVLNVFSNGRIRFMHEGFLRYPITLFGQYIEMQGNSAIKQRVGAYFYIDSGFVYSLLGYGLLLTIVAIVLYSILFRFSCAQDDKMLFIILVILMLFTVSNNVWLSLYYSPVILMSHPAIKATHSLKPEKRINEIDSLNNAIIIKGATRQ